MATEIERKFLVRRDAWRPTGRGVLYRQGYVSSAKERIVRVRIADSKSFITLKGAPRALARQEFEYEIPLADAAEILENLCERPLVEKTRYREAFAGRIWDVDEFHGENEGLLVAELELVDASEPFERPPWVGEEVSHDPRYFNSNLIRNPFKAWSE